MRRVRPEAHASAPLRLLSPITSGRSPFTIGAEGACCLRCPDEPCTRFTVDESGGGNSLGVCPADAISEARSELGPVVTSACVGCGICVMRCPVGALELGEDGIVTVARPDSLHTSEVASDDKFDERRAEVVPSVEWTDEQWSSVASRLAALARPLKQDAFYPLAALLFTAAGHPGWRPARGDTSIRIDLMLADEVDSLPVEVKSPTESEDINVKSVQQALENRIVLDERAFLPALPKSSTLVLGYAYPPARSDVAELIEDIARAYDINVGLIALPVLYELALRHQLAGTVVPRTSLSTLRGAL